MKRIGIVIITLVAIFSFTVNDVTAKNNIYEGVSLSLARQRAASVSDIKYDLLFVVPQQDTSKVRFNETMEFRYNGSEDLQIDFAGMKADVWKVNGRRCNAVCRNEHIIIPKAYLTKGVNKVMISGISADKALNRNHDYLYTLFVPALARTVFACFDQPDLKATFSLSLQLPEEWKAISTGIITKEERLVGSSEPTKIITFRDTELLPTYLFSFTAGKFFSKTAERDGRTIEALYRETDSTNVAQIDKVFDEVALSLRWLEHYTGMKYQFSKYGFVVLPGYQFGGMEHPGAIQFNDRRIFPGKNPTTDDELKRLELIAHETAHLWFGDLVTMRWFDDVWTKEVFANFLAAKISHEQFPNINHDLNFLKTYQTSAIATDRTDGTHPIQQQLDNLNQAGLLYGNIIYDKAPVMMRKLEQLMGQEAFRNGLQKYLQRFRFANATWDDLIGILNEEAPQAGVRQFSEVWVKQKGLPTITSRIEGKNLMVSQIDPFGRGLCWRQTFKMGLLGDKGNMKTVEVNMNDGSKYVTIPLDSDYCTVLPNIDGSGYGRFVIDTTASRALDIYTTTWQKSTDVERYAQMMTLYENYLMHRCSLSSLSNFILRTLGSDCSNELIESTLCDYLATLMLKMPKDERYNAEKTLYDVAKDHCHKCTKIKAMRIVSTMATSPQIVDSIYNVWKERRDTLISGRDYTNMAYHIAIMKPAEWQSIISEQRSRITNNDLKQMFDFVSRACNPDAEIQQQLFNSLLNKANRRVEPWASTMLSLLSCNTREPHNNAYLTPGLNALEDIQRTGDIFFPSDWLYALLSNHTCKEAKQIVTSWIQAHKDYPLPLRNKLLQAAFYLLN
jgi:aminopeptidase N